MRLLPFKVFTLQICHSKDAVCEIICSITDNCNIDRVPCTGKMPFSGTVSSDAFVITPNTDNPRNSYVPVMKGTLAENGADTEVVITMKLFHIVEVMIYLLTFLLLIMDSVLTISCIISKTMDHISSILLSMGVYFGFICYIHYLFNQEAKKAINKLKNALDYT